jgi:uncharacterized protein
MLRLISTRTIVPFHGNQGRFRSHRAARKPIRGIGMRSCGSHANTSSTQSSTNSFDPILHHVAQLLPHQGILENFVHHNPLETLEQLRFRDAVDYMHQLESYMSPGERMLLLVGVDPRKRVNEALVDLCSAFLDRGGAKWAPASRDKGFLYFFASLEGLGLAPWRQYARRTARGIEAPQLTESTAEELIKENLAFFGVPNDDWKHALRATVFDLKGWAGMFHRMETHKLEAPSNAKVRLVDFAAVQMILLRSSMEALARQFEWDLKAHSFASLLNAVPVIRPTDAESHSHGPVPWHTSAIATVDQTAERRELLESEMEKSLLASIISPNLGTGLAQTKERPKLQVFTCIDDRECSFRRHMEEEHPSEIETFGVAGFFGIPIKYQPSDGRDQMTLAPEGQDPTTVVVEGDLNSTAVSLKKRRRMMAQISRFWEGASFSPVGSLLLSFAFPFSMGRLLLTGFSPALRHNIKQRIHRLLLPQSKTDIQIPFTPAQSAALLARTFKDVGIYKKFAPLVVVVGHGASSNNNPFAAAYNCGACGGREGGPNARLLALMANNPAVRLALSSDHQINIPDDCIFIGAMHNTTTDIVEFFDSDKLPASHFQKFEEARRLVDRATGRNALERVNRFLLARQSVTTPTQALAHVQLRAIDAAEVRPELNHATNGAVVIGRRELTKGKSLDRRAFLPSYDPFADDDSGTNLEHVLAPALVVCSGINLEYLFSTIEADNHGAGTKAPLNIVGNIGVLQGTSGDLRPGLPTQMTEMHLPVRALFIVDAPILRVEAVLRRRPDLARLVRNEWVRFVVRDPSTGRLFKQSSGEYVPIESLDQTDQSAFGMPPFHHHTHGDIIVRKEEKIYRAAMLGTLVACIAPVYLYGAAAMNPYGAAIAVCGTLLALPVLAFSRRYLHGDYMFGRIALLCVGLVLGFNLVSTAPTLEHALVGWSLFGFASTFLIGAYNDRPTVKNNATFAFAAYRISDMAMLVAAALTAHAGPEVVHNPIVAGALLLAALFKSSQFPLTSLFVRSMEGPTPASALGYAGLSAHVGVVLLASTVSLWYPFEWARAVLACVGLVTAVHSTLVSKARSDRKGAVASATSATLGMIFILLAAGYPTVALVASLGHAAFRMFQILCAPNVIADSQALRSALGFSPWPRIVPDWLYRIAWALRRFDTDFHVINLLHRISRPFLALWPESRRLSRPQQWFVTAACIMLAGAPFTPVSDYLETVLTELIQTHPVLAGIIMVAHFGVAVLLMRFLFVNVLHPRRFFHHHATVNSNQKK